MISTKERSVLRGKANTLKPLVTVGKGGATEAVVAEIDTALYHRELVKVALLKSCEQTAKEVASVVSEALGAEVVQCIGNKAVFYRLSEKEGIEHVSLC